MRKIPREYENPIDNINLDFAEFMCPYFKVLNLTPNDLTTISFIFGLLSVYFWFASIFLTLSFQMGLFLIVKPHSLKQIDLRCFELRKR